MPGPLLSLDALNAATEPEFVAAVGPVFEHSPWIAARAAAGRPYASRAALHAALVAVVDAATTDEQLALIRAHPDLAGRLAELGRLTPESTQEQAAAGLATLDDAARAELQSLNAAYRARFGFPFVICARLNAADRILAAFRERLHHEADTERAAALAEIAKIAGLRLADRVAES